jgi:hypothetical protein
MRKLQIGMVVAVLAVAVAGAGCVARGRLRVAEADVEVGLLKNPSDPARAAANQLIADQALLRIAEGDGSKAVAALRALGVEEREAFRRILAAQAASAK